LGGGGGMPKICFCRTTPGSAYTVKLNPIELIEIGSVMLK